MPPDIADEDPEQFFSSDSAVTEAAIGICLGRCPVIAQCRADAGRITYGVWGGENRDKSSVKPTTLQADVLAALPRREGCTSQIVFVAKSEPVPRGVRRRHGRTGLCNSCYVAGRRAAQRIRRPA